MLLLNYYADDDRIVFVEPKTEADLPKATRTVIERLASRAYRRTASADELKRLTDLAASAQADGESYEASIQIVLQALLISPKFLFRVEPPKSDGDGDDLQASIDNGIKKIDDSTYEIDKKLVDQVLANPMAVAKGARVVPAVKNGKPDGFKLYAIRPSSVYAKLGLTNGDTIQSINGFELTTADKALEVYTKLREATSLEMEVTRRGKPVTLKYTIR